MCRTRLSSVGLESLHIGLRNSVGRTALPACSTPPAMTTCARTSRESFGGLRKRGGGARTVSSASGASAARRARASARLAVVDFVCIAAGKCMGTRLLLSWKLLVVDDGTVDADVEVDASSGSSCHALGSSASHPLRWFDSFRALPVPRRIATSLYPASSSDATAWKNLFDVTSCPMTRRTCAYPSRTRITAAFGLAAKLAYESSSRSSTGMAFASTRRV